MRLALLLFLVLVCCGEFTTALDLNNDFVIDLNDFYILNQAYSSDFELIDLVMLGNTFGTTIESACNLDNVCDEQETYYTCRNDCAVPHSKFTNTFLVYYGGGANFVPGDEVWLGKYDLLLLDRFRFDDINGDSWNAIKAVNENSSIILYLNGGYVANDQDQNIVFYLNKLGRYDVSRDHSMGSLNLDNQELFLLDSAGDRVYNTAYSTPPQYNLLMDFGNPVYQEYWSEAAITDLVYQPWRPDGIFMDDASTLYPSSLSSVPVDYPDDATWAPAMESFVEYVSERIINEGVLFYSNRGYSFSAQGALRWYELDNLQTPPTGAMDEGAFALMYGGGDVQFFPVEKWLEQLTVFEQLNHTQVLITSHTDLMPSQSGVDQLGNSVSYEGILWYSLCSYYLVKNDRLLFTFFGSAAYSQNWWYDEYDYLDFGPALGAFYPIITTNAVVYAREYRDAIVLVNPQWVDSSSVFMSGKILNETNFKEPELIPITDSFILEKHKGVVVLKV